RITRVEVLGGRFLYAIRVYSSGETFNLCPADVCQTTEGAELVRSACPVDAPRNGLRVEGYEPPLQIVRDVERIAAACGIEVGGIEYAIDERNDRLYYYDINALSNFVADAPRVVGFDPFARLVDFLQEETRRCASDIGCRYPADGRGSEARRGRVRHPRCALRAHGRLVDGRRWSVVAAALQLCRQILPRRECDSRAQAGAAATAHPLCRR